MVLIKVILGTPFGLAPNSLARIVTLTAEGIALRTRASNGKPLSPRAYPTARYDQAMTSLNETTAEVTPTDKSPLTPTS